ncbi:RagB/SusD family nutrient uptake outer membrane protein [Olivibacter ginsenosidimutans]|uniref:RagB/SusD family nutrient uptake outer membrane protein n=1 Tax=Olivibacter ginsenosidimutans TaxID=1176537 RepID=A0ABP9ADQ8_9SPHI
MKNRLTIKINQAVGCLLLLLFTGACSDKFLDAKPNSDIVTPSTLEDLEGLLENANVLNTVSPALPLLSADEYEFIDYENWQATATAVERNAYIWKSDLYEGQENIRDWNWPYQAIFYCNSILEALEKIQVTDLNEKRYNTVKGKALFFRAFTFFELARNFAQSYDAANAKMAMGIPLRLHASVDQVLKRSSLEETYQQIVTDTKSSSWLLKFAEKNTNTNNPSVCAAYALLARIYLNMRDYDSAENYVDSALSINNKLIDYNTVDVATATPFPKNHLECIFNVTAVQAYNVSYKASFNTAVKISSALFDEYKENDLRKVLFFEQNSLGNFFLKRGYEGYGGYAFSGLAADELYLIKAECLARRGNVEEAMGKLNFLLSFRYKKEEFTEEIASTASEALDIIWMERRKELIWRTLRWDDIKRLNMEGAHITIQRELNGKTYTLSPKDNKYIFPIPDDEIRLSGIAQNPR